MLRVQLGRGDQARRGRDEARPAEAAARARVFQRGTVQEPVEVTGQELSPCVQLPVTRSKSRIPPLAASFPANGSILIHRPAIVPLLPAHHTSLHSQISVPCLTGSH